MFIRALDPGAAVMGYGQSAPVEPPLTERNLPDQAGKVFIVTGATGKIGLQLTRMLYSVNAKIYLAGRSEERAEQVIENLQRVCPQSTGAFHFLHLDLSDLRMIKHATVEFLARETKLDALWSNAGIMSPAKGTKTTQGYEAQVGINALAPFLFIRLLLEGLKGNVSAPMNTRVIWVSSSAAGTFAPPGGVQMNVLRTAAKLDNASIDQHYTQWQWYGISRAATILLSYECGRRYSERGVESVAVDPGHTLPADVLPSQSELARKYDPRPAMYGAYTELFAGLSTRVSNRTYIIPWGGFSSPRGDIEASKDSGLDGSPSIAQEFWDWCEHETRDFA